MDRCRGTWDILGGNKDGEPTCLAPGARVATRRDYIIANTLAQSYITGFQVIHTDTHIPTHSILQLKISPYGTCNHLINTLRTCTPLHTLFQSKLEEDTSNSNNKQKKEITDQSIAKLHTYIDIQLRRAIPALNHARQQTDTTKFASLIYTSIEEAFVDYMGTGRRDKTRYKSQTELQQILDNTSTRLKQTLQHDPTNHQHIVHLDMISHDHYHIKHYPKTRRIANHFQALHQKQLQ